MTTPQRRPAVSATALALALGAAAGSAQAAVTAQEVWDELKSNMDLTAEGGVTVGSEDLAGGVLTVTDLAFNSTGEQGTVVTGTIPQVTFTENGDGTVSVAVPEEVPVTITSPADPATGSPATEVALIVRQAGATTTVSGEPGALAYDVSVDRYAIELDRLTQDGAEQPAEALLAFNDVAGTSTSTTTGEVRTSTGEFAAASMDVLVDLTNQEDGSRFNLSGQVQAVALNVEGAVPASMSTSPETALLDGLTGTVGYTTGPARYTFEVAGAAGPTSGTVVTEGGEATGRVSREAIGYDVSSRGVQVDVTSAQMPPISVSLAEYGLNALIPAAKSDTPQPFSSGINLTDLSVNEEVWQLIDPQGLLAHDPATVIMQISGTATPLFDLFDPAQQQAMALAPMPAEVNSVSLDDLNISIGGAQVTGTGSFTLDNADTTTFPGIPRPEGVAEFQLNGVNGLIDDLVAMGLLPQEQVMGARMVLGLLAVPVGDDQLTSRIEVTPDGQLLANGQRLQ